MPREVGMLVPTNIPFHPRNGSTILVADDFEEFRRFVRRKFSENGFQTVAEATDGFDAVAKARELRPSLILLDISMPKLNGIEAAEQIHFVAPESKVLFLSCNTDPDVVESALKVGAAGYLHKATMDRDLLPAIEAVLAGKTFISTDLPRRAAPSDISLE